MSQITLVTQSILTRMHMQNYSRFLQNTVNLSSTYDQYLEF